MNTDLSQYSVRIGMRRYTPETLEEKELDTWSLSEMHKYSEGQKISFEGRNATVKSVYRQLIDKRCLNNWDQVIKDEPHPSAVMKIEYETPFSVGTSKVFRYAFIEGHQFLNVGKYQQ